MNNVSDDRPQQSAGDDPTGSDRVPVPYRPRVVVVDDHERMRWALGELFTAAGLDVVASLPDGTGVVDAVRHTRPDVVVTDLHMPICDGVATIRRAHLADPAVRVVVFTAAVTDPDELLAVGAVAVIPKGVMPDVLLRAVSAAARGES